jgi:putative peptide zinc metalloprotease protein
MAVLSVVGVVFNLGLNLTRILRAPRQDPLSRPKIAVTLSIVAAVLIAALTIPLPIHLEAAFYIEPHDVRHVYTKVAGELGEINVSPGARVQTGDVLLQLDDFDKRDRLTELEIQLAAAEVEVLTQEGQSARTAVELARQRRDSLIELKQDQQEQINQLTIKSPIDGILVEPPRIAEPKLSHPRMELSVWHGIPLDRQNLGCLLQPGTHVASIAPDDRYQAILLVDQADRGDLEVGRELEIKFEHLPNATYQGTIREISPRHLEFAPDVLSNKQGGDLPTVTDRKGRERLTSHAYQALVVLEGDVSLLKSGIRGKARFLVGHRSAAQWLWRIVRRTFHFRL